MSAQVEPIAVSPVAVHGTVTEKLVSWPVPVSEGPLSRSVTRSEEVTWTWPV